MIGINHMIFNVVVNSMKKNVFSSNTSGLTVISGYCLRAMELVAAQ